MALFIQKPIFWNTQAYVAPSGVIASSGYPKDTGYGHEEWNNSSRMLLQKGQQRFRVFHTEGLGNAPIDENAGQTFVFMTVSHDNVQQLVGIAGNAVCLAAEHHREQREKLAKALSLNNLQNDAWAVPNVQHQYGGSRKDFLADWKKDLHWIPNWLCPDDYFLWLDEPVTLNPREITGQAKLLGMFGTYTNLERSVAARFLDAIPLEQRGEKWQRLSDAIQCAPSEPISAEEMANEGEPITSVLTYINARRGQGQFREDLIRIWGGACAVTGINCRELLIASHIKPWATSKGKQKLDEHNGLLLSANLDALFDIGLISFGNDGQMMISPRLHERHRTELGLPMPLRFLPKEVTPYLEYHREKVFQS
ncbi:HNH endonuclease [Janthinobacterium sp. NKUCC06_STL]|uniref:HNH endonuclease n=1 Tax=Janthinobacterium sp. NKUCC06_STL TaxID=2842127 RepID=UPI001C5ADFD1|nr:HNH endonuclease [Janthinobacterium sp. NKUCC06_STL]MBW3510590.1 HNH endonuclease [Janthinobacterium sp. NKUCC06_STL]